MRDKDMRETDIRNKDQADLSKQVKELAAEQPLTLELTEQQLEGLRALWDKGDPRKPAQITFMVQGKPLAEMAVAGYRYRGDTCCA